MNVDLQCTASHQRQPVRVRVEQKEQVSCVFCVLCIVFASVHWHSQDQRHECHVVEKGDKADFWIF